MINFFIKTYGCQANVADSANLQRYFRRLGGVLVGSEADADLIVINTCAIREKAEHKMFSYVGNILKLKKAKPYLKVFLIGCVASYRKKDIRRRFTLVDFIFGARDDIEIFKTHVPGAFKQIEKEKAHAFVQDSCTKSATTPDNADASPLIRSHIGDIHSMINIMRGCNNYCSYCIVPFTTGRERSYPMSTILDRIKRDVDAGAKEITLLGQNVNSYKDPETGARFETLLDRAANIDGDFWIRFVSPHPKDMTSDVLDVMAHHMKKKGIPKLCSYIHLPLQSGSNKILESMNRTYTVEKYMDLVSEIKEKLPCAAISTDIIVGFPGEGEEDYQATRRVMDEVHFNMIYSFIYSPRKYTKAAEMPDDCPSKIKQERLQKLQARHREIGSELNKKLVGKTFWVLLEGTTPEGFLGRTEGNTRVFVDNAFSHKKGDFVRVKITDARLSDLRGECIEISPEDGQKNDLCVARTSIKM